MMKLSLARKVLPLLRNGWADKKPAHISFADRGVIPERIVQPSRNITIHRTYSRCQERF